MKIEKIKWFSPQEFLPNKIELDILIQIINESSKFTKVSTGNYGEKCFYDRWDSYVWWNNFCGNKNEYLRIMAWTYLPIGAYSNSPSFNL